MQAIGELDADDAVASPSLDPPFAVLHGARDAEVEWSFFFPLLLARRGMLAMRRGKLEPAAESLVAAGRAAGEWGLSTPAAMQWRPPAAEALGSLGRTDEARG